MSLRARGRRRRGSHTSVHRAAGLARCVAPASYIRRRGGVPPSEGEGAAAGRGVALGRRVLGGSGGGGGGGSGPGCGGADGVGGAGAGGGARPPSVGRKRRGAGGALGPRLREVGRRALARSRRLACSAQ